MTRVCLGFGLAILGLTLAFSAGFFWSGTALAILGLMLCPTEAEEQARMGKCCIPYRRGFTHGFGECSEMDCRL